MAEVFFTVHRTQMFSAMQHVSRAVDGKGKIPILTHVLLSVEEGGLRIRGTNLDIQIEAECDVIDVNTPVALALPAMRLGDILKLLPESATISFEKGRLQHQTCIRAGPSTFNLSYLPATDMPDMTPREAFAWTEVDGASLSEALAKVSYAVSKVEDRPYLKGICLHSSESGAGMAVCGLDGTALACVRMPASGSPDFPKRNESYPHIILPVNTAAAIQKLLDEAKSPAMMAVTESMVGFRFGGIEIKSKLVDWVYPVYESVIPARTENTFVVAREALLGAVRRVSAVGVNPTGQEYRDGVRLKVQGGQLRVDLLTQEGGYAEDFIAADIKAPEGYSVACDVTQLERMLSAIKSSDIEVVLTEHAETAIRVEPVGRSTETHLLMPMRPRFVAVD